MRNPMHATLATLSMLVLCACSPNEPGGPAPQPLTRQIALSGLMIIVDDETFTNDEYAHVELPHVSTMVGTNQEVVLLNDAQGCAGDEVRVLVDATASLTPSGAALITGSARMLEGTDCTNQDEDGTEFIMFTVQPGETVAREIFVLNDDEGAFNSGDQGQIVLVVSNLTPGATPPPPQARTVSVSGHMDITDDETWTSNEHGSQDFSGSQTLLEKQSGKLVAAKGCAGDEVAITVDLDASVSVGGTTVVSGLVRMMEGTDCHSNDQDGFKSFSLVVPPDQTVIHDVFINNTDEGGDHAKVHLAVSNFAG